MKKICCPGCQTEYSRQEKKCPNCGHSKPSSLISFVICMLVLFCLFNFISQIGSGIAFFSILNYKYGTDFIFEVLWIIFILLALVVRGNTYIFKEKRQGFFCSILLGLPLLVLSVVLLISSISSLDTISIPNFLNLILYCISIGIAEEFLCRGLIQNEFVERFGRTEKQVIVSIVLSSFFFGLMHITNILAGQSVVETIMQIIQATAAGTLFGSIYYKTKNIWSVVFLHAFYDFSIMLGDVNLIKDCTTGVVTNSIFLYQLINSILLCLFYIVAVVLIWKKNEKTKKKQFIPYYACLIVLFVLIFFPVNGDIIEGYEEYNVCYHYDELDLKNYETHFFSYDGFLMHYQKTVMDSEVPATEEYSFRVYYDDDDASLKMKNLVTNDEIVFDFEDVVDFEVLENDDHFLLIAYDYGKDSIVYYAKIGKESINNEITFLEKIKSLFVSYDLPVLNQGGYITIRGDDYKYPYFVSEYKDTFMIDEKGRLFVLK